MVSEHSNTLTIGRSLLWPTTAVPDSPGTSLAAAEPERAAGQRLSAWHISGTFVTLDSCCVEMKASRREQQLASET